MEIFDTAHDCCLWVTAHSQDELGRLNAWLVAGWFVVHTVSVKDGMFVFLRKVS